MVNEIFAGLSLMPDDNFRVSTYPLFEEGIVDWIEWTIDMGWSKKGVPKWLDGLLEFYGNAGRLSGHGVQYSALSARWMEEQDVWLRNLQVEVKARKYAHISEHFGFARAGNYALSAPFPIPLCKQALETGQENLAKIANIAKCPVGIENLALAFGLHDVEAQGFFLESLIAPIDGFLVLDIHNIFCQSINFGIPVMELIHSYPLDMVLEIHISGGSFSTSKHGYADKPIRRDTHDGPVPVELYELLPDVLKLCPNVQVVILERIGNTFTDKKVIKDFADEFRKLKSVLEAVNRQRGTETGAPSSTESGRTWTRDVIDDNQSASRILLDEWQSKLLDLLGDERNAKWIQEELQRDTDLEAFLPYTDLIEPRMLEVGQELIRKWGVKR